METQIRYHKADVLFHGRMFFTSQRCHSWRPEATQRDLDGNLHAKVYFGMGAQECLGIEYSFVVFTSRLSVLVAIADVLGDNVFKRQRGVLQ
jgi:hypothetical protein